MITRYYIFPNVCLRQGQNQLNWVIECQQREQHYSILDLKCSFCLRNSIAGAIQVATHLQGQLGDHLQF